MNAKLEMKRLRDYLRREMRRLRKDPFLKDVAPHISVRMTKWDAARYAVVLQLQDTRKPVTEYNSQSTKWVMVNTYSDYRWDVWRALNALIVEMRMGDKKFQ